MEDSTVCWGWMDWLFKICDHSKHIYAFDADIDSHTLWCLEQIRNHQPEQFALYMNAADWGKDYEIDYFHGYEQILADLIASINAGKKVALALDVKDAMAQSWVWKISRTLLPKLYFAGMIKPSPRTKD